MITISASTYESTLIPEFLISRDDNEALAELLEICFPETSEGRTYFKQVPHARLFHRENGKIVAQTGLDYRVIRVGAEVVTVLGIIDLCVTPGMRSNGIGSALLDASKELAKKANAEFIILFADNSDLYTRNGYGAVTPAPITWLAIEDRSTYGIEKRDFTGILMALPIKGSEFPEGEIDLLGYLF